MRALPLPSVALALAICLPISAWSPRFHEAQTGLAMSLVPTAMNRYLSAHAEALRTGARGFSNDQVPSVEDVEAQYQRVIALSEEGKPSKVIVKELGVLAHQVQLMMDPSATVGVTPLREQFEAYGDEYLPKMTAFKEPFWAVSAPLEPRPQLLKWAAAKYERNRLLQAHIDPNSGKRTGGWDVLSPPFAQLQLSFSNGVNATANIWILLWRSVGESWDVPAEE